MRQNSYDSEPLPLTLSEEQVAQGGKNDYLPYMENAGISGAIPIDRYLSSPPPPPPPLIRSNNKKLRSTDFCGKLQYVAF